MNKKICVGKEIRFSMGKKRKGPTIAVGPGNIIGHEQESVLHFNLYEYFFRS